MKHVKSWLRARLLACGPCYLFYTRLKYRAESLWFLGFCLHDLKNVMRYMHWGEERAMPKGQLQAKLLFYYHKIEKGLSMPGVKRLFALDVIPRVIQLLQVWEANGHDRQDPIYLGATSSLRSYRGALLRHQLDPDSRILPLVDAFLEPRRPHANEQITPMAISREQIDAVLPYDEFSRLCRLRRSFRDFRDAPVADDVLDRAVELAQLSPSACNRQPCKVYVVREPALKKRLLEHQNGNAGFGHLAPVVLVITADMSHFFDASERHQPFVDGGLFSMSLLYALQVQGLVSCCLNWCVAPKTDASAHRLLAIPASERIVMCMLAGHPPLPGVVPRSHRKALDAIVVHK